MMSAVTSFVNPVAVKVTASKLMIATIMVTKDENPEMARDTMMGVLMIVLNGLLGKRTRDLDRYEETLQEALFMQNSPMLHGALGGESLVQKVLRSQPNARERLTRLFLNILTRPPSPSELKRYESYVSAQKESLEAYQDVAWTLLNTSEFRYNH